MSKPSVSPAVDAAVPLTIDDVMRRARHRLQAGGIETAQLDARVLVGHVLGMGHGALIAQGQQSVASSESTAIDRAIARRLAHEPVALITGRKEFWGLIFHVNAATLVPRPDSETLVEAVLDHAGSRASSPGLRILDLGTGTGCLLLSLLHELPQATGVGCDIEKGAVRLAERNAQSLGLSERCEFKISNWADSVNESFDIIICNPPYIRRTDILDLQPDVCRFEPKSALDGGEQGLDAYHELRSHIARCAKKGAFVALEVGQGQAESVRKLLFSEPNLKFLGFRTDLAGIQRCVVGQKVN